MQSTCRRVLFAVLLASVPVLSHAAAGGTVLQFSTSVNGANPCTGEAVSGSLDVLLVVNQISTGNGETHVNVQGSFHGRLTGSLGTTYQVSAEGHDQFLVASGAYDFPFRVEAISHGSAPNLTLDGVARVFVNGAGDPTGATIVSVTPNCD